MQYLENCKTTNHLIFQNLSMIKKLKLFYTNNIQECKNIVLDSMHDRKLLTDMHNKKPKAKNNVSKHK